MTIKAIVSKLAARFLSREDLTALAGDSTLQELVVQASQTLRHVAAQTGRQSAEYRELSGAAEAFVLNVNRASTLGNLALSHVARTQGKAYFIAGAIQRIVEEHYVANNQPVVLGYSGDLAANVQASLDEARGITNVIKRRAVVRAGIKAHLPEITNDRSAALVELLLQLS